MKTALSNAAKALLISHQAGSPAHPPGPRLAVDHGFNSKDAFRMPSKLTS